jgi:hypothetical protein
MKSITVFAVVIDTHQPDRSMVSGLCSGEVRVRRMVSPKVAYHTNRRKTRVGENKGRICY